MTLQRTAYFLGRMAALTGREIRVLGRKKGPVVLRVSSGALAAAIVLPMLWGKAGWNMAISAALAFEAAVIVQCLLAVWLGAILGVTSVQSERRDRTLGLLVVSGVHPYEIVLAKIVALVALLSMILLAALPVYGLLGWAGGMEYVWLARLALLTVALAAFSVTVGVAVALRLRGTLTSAFGTLVILFFLLAWLPAMAPGYDPDYWTEGLFPLPTAQVVAQQGKHADPAARRMSHPSHAQGAAPGMSAERIYRAGIALLFLGALAGSALAARILPRGAMREPGRGLRGLFERADAFYERINVGGIHVLGDGRPPPLHGNPVAWLDRTGKGTGSPHNTVRLGTLMLVPALFINGIAVGEEYEVVTVLWALVAGIAGIAAGAGAIAGERRGKTMTVLASTPLTAETILKGKWQSFLRMLVYLFALPLLFAVVIIGFNAPHDLGVIPSGCIVVAGEAFLAFTIALLCSLLLATPLRAGLTAFVLWLAAHVVPFLAAGGIYFSIEEKGPWSDTSGITVAFIFHSVLALGGVAWHTRNPRIGFAAIYGTFLWGIGLIGGALATTKFHLGEVTDLLGEVSKGLFSGASYAPDGESLLTFLIVLGFTAILAHYTARITDSVLGRTT